ncbi:hypothetical protein AAIR29_07995 [Psychrobacter sp. FBL11]|uniref:Uncharacterized protein n=1 Tax=Psychrobacter saeujeotis TaxID=3143436 RepID=A0ABU9X841_9GAMM|nr:hypothetical protein [uncultured Psychrobacter sp.]
MSVLIGVGIVTTITTIYLGKKGWQAFHKAVGITPGVLKYRDRHAPLSLSTLNWRQLNLNKKHLQVLPDHQLRQLQRIDEKVNSYYEYQKALSDQNKTSAVTEQQFVVDKMLHTRLSEMLASRYHLASIHTTANQIEDEKNVEADELLQQVLNSIEQRLDELLAQMQTQHLQELQVMKNYIDSHDS